MRPDERVSRAIVPMICSVFSTGIAAVICIELAGQLLSVPTFAQIMIFAIPAGYWVLSVMTIFGVISKDGAVVLSLILIPVFIAFIVIEAFIMSLQLPIGVGGIG